MSCLPLHSIVITKVKDGPVPSVWPRCCHIANVRSKHSAKSWRNSDLSRDGKPEKKTGILAKCITVLKRLFLHQQMKPIKPKKKNRVVQKLHRAKNRAATRILAR